MNLIIHEPKDICAKLNFIKLSFWKFIYKVKLYELKSLFLLRPFIDRDLPVMKLQVHHYPLIDSLIAESLRFNLFITTIKIAVITFSCLVKSITTLGHFETSPRFLSKFFHQNWFYQTSGSTSSGQWTLDGIQYHANSAPIKCARTTRLFSPR